jgi:predicted PhzF superfamily epimerase YddE/YHI9
VPEFWLTRVFHDAGIDGNLTGIVVGPVPPERERCQAVATELGLPDTAFVDLTAEPPPLLLSFSAREELSFCTQSLLAATMIGSLRGGGRAADFRTKLNTVSVTAGAAGVWWVTAEPEAATLLEPADAGAALVTLGIDSGALAGPVAITGLGRRRLYCRFEALDALHAQVLTPERVKRVCADHGLNGVCLFVRQSADLVASRVFTTSLGGSEASATGGAALGLLGCDRLLGLDLATTVRVEQGQAGSQLRGCLFARRQGDRAQLGGNVKILTNGTLLGRAD